MTEQHLALDRHMESGTIHEPRPSDPSVQPPAPGAKTVPGRAADLWTAAAAVESLPVPNGADADTVRATLARIVDCVDRRANSEDAPVAALRSHRLAVPLLARFRMALGQVWSEAEAHPAPSRMLSVWLALDSVALDLAEPAPPEAAFAVWERDFAGQLSGPQGLDLVVEVAHDLRSPLTSILFLAETLQRGQSGPVNDIQRRQLGLIYSAALGLSTLASNVMELARGGSRLAEDVPAPFSVRDLFESVADIVRPMAEEKGLTVRLLPPTNDHRLGPAQALARVMLNLTTNAIKFTEEGFVELVAKATGSTEIEFSVRDTGRGINPDTIDTLFQPFKTGSDSTGRAFSGTGLGLALCRKLVEAMGSELQYETSPDWGTRFYFSLAIPSPES